MKFVHFSVYKFFEIEIEIWDFFLPYFVQKKSLCMEYFLTWKPEKSSVFLSIPLCLSVCLSLSETFRRPKNSIETWIPLSSISNTNVIVYFFAYISYLYRLWFDGEGERERVRASKWWNFGPWMIFHLDCQWFRYKIIELTI